MRYALLFALILGGCTNHQPAECAFVPSDLRRYDAQLHSGDISPQEFESLVMGEASLVDLDNLTRQGMP